MVFEKIAEIVANQLGVSVEDINLNTSFDGDLGADSLDLFEIISEIEAAYDLEFSADDTEKIKTIGDCVTFIENEIAQ